MYRYQLSSIPSRIGYGCEAGHWVNGKLLASFRGIDCLNHSTIKHYIISRCLYGLYAG
jgi:hypothetical protein